MNKKRYFNNIVLNLGILSLNEMQEVSQDAILNDATILCLSGKQTKITRPQIKNIPTD
jgi:hypothetical protein